MYGIFTYIWVIFRVNVGKYTIHGAYGDYGGDRKQNPVAPAEFRTLCQP